MFRISFRFVLALIVAVPLPSTGLAAAQAPAKSSVMITRSEHAWSGGGRSSTFDAHWHNGELKMIREEFAPSSG
ncbi:MAG: hypothetical protein Q8L65_02510, partial [Burkholderiales bacterium]|nr:hypothetical protein [Burkholderiales bacterium]